MDGLPIKAKKVTFLHEVRLTLLDINPVFQCLWDLLITLLIDTLFFFLQIIPNSTKIGLLISWNKSIFKNIFWIKKDYLSSVEGFIKIVLKFSLHSVS